MDDFLSVPHQGPRLCQQCVRLGLKSEVRAINGCSGRLGGPDEFWDEEGVFHYHDQWRYQWAFRCSRGHRWGGEAPVLCPAPSCPWNATLAPSSSWELEDKCESVLFPAAGRLSREEVAALFEVPVATVGLEPITIEVVSREDADASGSVVGLLSEKG